MRISANSLMYFCTSITAC